MDAREGVEHSAAGALRELVGAQRGGAGEGELLLDRLLGQERPR